MMQSTRPRFWRTSLRELLAAAAFVAVGTTGLMYAGDTAKLIASSAVMIALLWATAAAVGNRGPRQAFAAAFLLVACGYVVAVYSGVRFSTGNLSRQVDEFEPFEGRLPTTWVLRKVFMQLRRVEQPNSNSLSGGTGMGPGVFDGGGGSLGVGLGGGGGLAWSIERPDRHDFMVVGHALWLLVLGYLAGRAAGVLAARREFDAKGCNAESGD